MIDFGVAKTTDSDMALTTMQTDVGRLIARIVEFDPFGRVFRIRDTLRGVGEGGSSMVGHFVHDNRAGGRRGERRSHRGFTIHYHEGQIERDDRRGRYSMRYEFHREDIGPLDQLRDRGGKTE